MRPTNQPIGGRGRRDLLGLPSNFHETRPRFLWALSLLEMYGGSGDQWVPLRDLPLLKTHPGPNPLERDGKAGERLSGRGWAGGEGGLRAEDDGAGNFGISEID